MCNSAAHNSRPGRESLSKRLGERVVNSRSAAEFIPRCCAPVDGPPIGDVWGDRGRVAARGNAAEREARRPLADVAAGGDEDRDLLVAWLLSDGAWERELDALGYAEREEALRGAWCGYLAEQGLDVPCGAPAATTLDVDSETTAGRVAFPVCAAHAAELDAERAS